MRDSGRSGGKINSVSHKPNLAAATVTLMKKEVVRVGSTGIVAEHDRGEQRVGAGYATSAGDAPEQLEVLPYVRHSEVMKVYIIKRLPGRQTMLSAAHD